MHLNPGQLRFITLCYLEIATGDDAVDWALCELESGNDSDSLRIVAGNPKPVVLSDVGRHVEMAFSTLGYDKLVSDEVRLRYVTHLVCHIAKDIVDGKMRPLQGLDNICDVFEQYSCAGQIEECQSVNLFEWYEMYNGFHPETLDRTAEADMASHVVRYAKKLLERPHNRTADAE